MKSLIIAAAALATAAALSACSSSPASSSAVSPPSAHPKPASCRQLYEAWRHDRLSSALKASMRKVQAEAAVLDIPALKSALVKAGTASAGLIAHPAPACADPAGYWRQIFDRIQAAGDNAKSASGIAGLVLAEAPLKAIPGLERKLTAELRRTTGT